MLPAIISMQQSILGYKDPCDWEFLCSSVFRKAPWRKYLPFFLADSVTGTAEAAIRFLSQFPSLPTA